MGNYYNLGVSERGIAVLPPSMTTLNISECACTLWTLELNLGIRDNRCANLTQFQGQQAAIGITAK